MQVYHWGREWEVQQPNSLTWLTWGSSQLKKQEDEWESSMLWELLKSMETWIIWIMIFLYIWFDISCYEGDARPPQMIFCFGHKEILHLLCFSFNASWGPSTAPTAHATPLELLVEGMIYTGWSFLWLWIWKYLMSTMHCAICSSSCLLIRPCCNPIFSYITYWCWRASRKTQRGWGFKCRLSQLSFPGKMIGDYGRKRLFREVQDLLDKLILNLSKPWYLWYEHFCMAEAAKSYWSM